MFTYQLTLVCDICRKAMLDSEQQRTPSRKAIIKLAIDRGWKVGVKQTCRDCLKRKRR